MLETIIVAEVSFGKRPAWNQLGSQRRPVQPPHQSLVYLTAVEYIERELAKIHSPVLPMWSAKTERCANNKAVLEFS